MSTRSDAVTRRLDTYETIIQRFICGDSSADRFESSFLSYFTNDKNQVVGDEFEVSTAYSQTSTNTSETHILEEQPGASTRTSSRSRASEAYVRLYGKG